MRLSLVHVLSVLVLFFSVPRAFAADAGAAPADLTPLRVFRPDPEAPDGLPLLRETFLVHPGTARQRELEALCQAEGGESKAILFEEIRREGAAAVPDLAAFATDPRRTERCRLTAIKLLGALGDPAVVPPLVQILGGNTDPFPREAAAVALGLSGRAEAIPALSKALGDPEPGVSLRAAWALAHLGDIAGVPIALARISDSRADIALRALEAIEEAGDRKTLPALERNLAATSGLTRTKTRRAIAALTLRQREGAARITYCTELLADPEPEIRRLGAGTLARLPAPEAGLALDRAAADPQHPGRGEAIQAARARQRIALPQRGTVIVE